MTSEAVLDSAEKTAPAKSSEDRSVARVHQRVSRRARDVNLAEHAVRITKRAGRSASAGPIRRHHVDHAERRRALRDLCVHLSHPLHRPKTGLRRRLRRGPPEHRTRLLEAGELQRDLLDDSADGILPARTLRRLRNLLPRALPHAPAKHRHVVLLQRGPIRRRLGTVRPWTAHQRGLRDGTMASTNGCPMQASPCAPSSCSASSSFLFAPETKGKPLPE